MAKFQALNLNSGRAMNAMKFIKFTRLWCAKRCGRRGGKWRLAHREVLTALTRKNFKRFRFKAEF
ncbi:hypothetical protein [uncultured Campylobacter sp.]|uniref:hypothetical protein n=1 Tax=uncultured Campylobacter sp. TaxID=218934 RepID=UPI0026119813|nr:hypothetical protein [uncultured Campylobacter sp.]